MQNIEIQQKGILDGATVRVGPVSVRNVAAARAADVPSQCTHHHMTAFSCTLSVKAPGPKTPFGNPITMTHL